MIWCSTAVASPARSDGSAWRSSAPATRPRRGPERRSARRRPRRGAAADEHPARRARGRRERPRLSAGRGPAAVRSARRRRMSAGRPTCSLRSPAARGRRRPRSRRDRAVGRARALSGGARARMVRRGMPLAPLLDRRSAACVLAMAGIYRRLLDRIEARPERVAGRTRIAAGPREGVGRPRMQHAEPRWAPVQAGARQAAMSVVVVVGRRARRDHRRPGLRGRRRAGDARRGQAHGWAGRRTRSSATGCSIDNGQHVFLRCCQAYRALLERLGSTELRRASSRGWRSRC